MPEDTGSLGRWNRKQTVVGGRVGVEDGGFFAQLRHRSHGWIEDSGGLSREAGDQAINVESTKCWAVNEKRSPSPCLRCLSSWFTLCPAFRLAHVLWSGQHTLRSGIASSLNLFSIIWTLFVAPGGLKKGIKLCNNKTFPVSFPSMSFISCCEWILLKWSYRLW